MVLEQSLKRGAAIIAMTAGATCAAFAGPAEDDFARRVASPGVMRSFGFDAASGITPYVHPDGRFEASGSGFDSSMKASGAGAVRFTVPALSGSNSSGALKFSLSPDVSVTFGPGEDFYIQWRQRFDTTFLNHKYAGSGGWKQMIVGESDHNGYDTSSCTEMDVVMQNVEYGQFPKIYHSCAAYAGFYEPVPGAADFKLQNAMPSPFCLYSDPTRAGCFMYYANEWMTFQMHIRPGPRGTATSKLEQKSLTGFTNSIVQVWVAREGQPSKLVHDWSGVVLRETAGYEFGKLWLLPYQTDKDGSVSGPVSNTWYDELIISTQKIPDPGYAQIKPNPPTNVRAQ
jgi:hypothetical protein